MVGKWEWVIGKEAIIIEIEGRETELKILRLTNRELWYETENYDEIQCEKISFTLLME